MSANPRRESLSLFDILNHSSGAPSPAPHHSGGPSPIYDDQPQQQYTEPAESSAVETIKAENEPTNTYPMDAPDLAPVVQVKMETSRDGEFNEDDQELLAAAEVSTFAPGVWKGYTLIVRARLTTMLLHPRT